MAINDMSKLQHNNFNLQKLKLLVAEDNKINQIVIGKMLKRLKIDFELFENGLQVLTEYSERPNHFDIILMDCEMPIMDGYKAAESIRLWEYKNKAKPIPIIAVTAHALEEFEIKSKKVGMNSFVSKPIALEKLSSALLQNSKS